jgi:hypothetical protein
MRAPASIVVVLLALLAAPALAQESRFQSDLRREGEDLKESCSGFNPKALVGCIVTVATEHHESGLRAAAVYAQVHGRAHGYRG